MMHSYRIIKKKYECKKMDKKKCCGDLCVWVGVWGGKDIAPIPGVDGSLKWP